MTGDGRNQDLRMTMQSYMRNSVVVIDGYPFSRRMANDQGFVLFT